MAIRYKAHNLAMETLSDWRRRMLIATAGALVVLLGLATVWRAGPYNDLGHTWGSRQDHSDFTVYLAAGQAVRKGTDIYRARNDRGWAYVYPPPLAIVMAPLSLMPVPWAVFVGYLVSLALTVLAFRWCAWLASAHGIRGSPLYWLLPLLLVAPYLANGLLRGQASIPMAALVVGAIYYESRGFSLRGALCLSGAVLLKVFPIALLAYFAWRRRWRFCAWTAAALVSGGLLFPAAVFDLHQAAAYLVEWVHVVGQPALGTHAQRTHSPLYSQLLQWGKLHDQSLYAVLGRLVSRTDLSLAPHVRSITAAFIAAMLLPLYAVGRRASGTARLSVVAAFLVWMLLASPITEKHYFTLLLPFFVIGGNALHGTPRARTLARALVVLFGLGAVVASLPKDSVAVLWNDGWLCWSCVLLWAGLLALGLDGRRADIRQAAHEAEAATPDPAPRWQSVSLILPMYNEAANVDETLAAALSCLHHDFVDFEIVAVDDASTDGCADWVAEWAGRKPAIKLVRLAHNRRFGGSLRAGFDAARGDLLVYTDFDLPVPLEHLPQALAALASADELTGHAPGVSKHGSRQAALVSAAYNFLVRTLFGLRLQDINFGFKVMPRSVWRSLSPVSNSPFLDAEMLIQAMRLGYRIKQVEVPFSPRRGGVSRMRRFTVIAATLADMARLWGRLSSGRVETRQVVQL